MTEKVELPKTMKALQLGKKREIIVNKEHKMAKRKCDRSFAVNPPDLKIRHEFPQLFFTATGFKILGFDMCGEVMQIGKLVEKVGDIVCGNSTFKSPGCSGCYAEYTSFPYTHLTHVPEGMKPVVASAHGTTSTTVWQMFTKFIKDLPNNGEGFEGKLKGKSVCVIGASGGTGSWGVLLASKFFGAKVYAVCSPKNHEYAKSLGADVCIDYKTQKFDAIIRDDKDLCAILDMIGGEEYNKICLSLVEKRKEVEYVCIGGDIFKSAFKSFFKKKMKFFLASTDNSGEIYGSVLTWMHKNKLDDLIPIKQWKLEECEEAHKLQLTGRVVGKNVFNVAGVV